VVTFSTEVVLLLVGIGGAAVLAALTTLANLVRNATALHDLTVSAAALRINYDKQLAGEKEAEIIEVDEAPQEAARAT
jgi:hypothetical protein